jgi:hypothetical protein
LDGVETGVDSFLKTIGVFDHGFITGLRDTVIRNEGLNVASLAGLSSFFSRATENDLVLLYVIGHGFYDTLSLDLRIELTAFQFDQPPELNTLTLDRISAVLDDLRARQKLLIVDACFSGKNDGSSQESDKLVFATMNRLFADIQNESGTTVISAVGGENYEFVTSNGTILMQVLNSIFRAGGGWSPGARDLYLSDLMDAISANFNRIQDMVGGVPELRLQNFKTDYRIW